MIEQPISDIIHYSWDVQTLDCILLMYLTGKDTKLECIFSTAKKPRYNHMIDQKSDYSKHHDEPYAKASAVTIMNTMKFNEIRKSQLTTQA